MSENIDLETFTEAYARLLVAVWTDLEVADRLRKDPHSVAADVGLVIPGDVDIALVEAAGDPVADPQASLKAYYGEFQEGLRAKAVTLVVPPAPGVASQELSLEELSEAAGGIAICCAPCCCCYRN